MYERILLAVDGGSSSELAVSHAVLVAKAMNAEVKAIFVVDDSELFFENRYANPDDVLRDLFSVGQQTLSRVAMRVHTAGVRCTTAVIERPVSPGQISSTIVSQANMWLADLIVMGTHGRRGVRRMIMGSVSEGVVAKTGKPVLLARSAGTPERAVCPVHSSGYDARYSRIVTCHRSSRSIRWRSASLASGFAVHNESADKC